MADVENPAVIDGVEIAEPHEERNRIVQQCAALFMVVMFSCLAFLLSILLPGTNKAVHSLGVLGIAVLFFLDFLILTCVYAQAVTSCVYGNTEGKQQQAG
jgi:lipopolysaccharide export LptBFGC system permease protein LptF